MLRNVVIALFAALLLQASALDTPGNGIGGVNVGIRKKPGKDLLANATTNAEGNFTFTGLATGSYTLTVTMTPAQQQASNPNAKSFYESRSNTARSVGGMYLFAFTGWPYEASLQTSGITTGTGTIAMVGSNVVITIDVDVNPVRGSTATISGVLKKSGGTNPLQPVN